MHKRQAPQEIIETNEVDEADGDDWNEANDDVDDEKMQDSSEEDKSEESEAPDFQEVKLISKHAAFLRKSNQNKFYLHYSTQNQRKRLVTDPQKIEIESEFVPTIQKIIKNYPQYVKCGDGAAFGLLDELAELQIVIVR